MKNSTGKSGLAILFAAIFLSFTTTKTDWEKSKPEGSMPFKRQAFEIENINPVAIPLDKIDQVYKFKPENSGDNFRCVTTYSPFATDIGTYNELYLLFNNGCEMPHRSAIFLVGTFFDIVSFEKILESVFQIQCIMFEQNELFFRAEVSLRIDASDVVNKEKQYRSSGSMVEGAIPSKILVTAEN